MSEAFFFDTFLPAVAFTAIYVVPLTWFAWLVVKKHARKGRRYE